jgi:hypothetical protein
LAAVATVAGVGGVGAATAGGDERTAARTAHAAAPSLVVARFADNGVTGVVYAAREGRSRKVYVGVSLHGLASGRTYEVRGVRRPCARDVEGAALEDATVFRTTSWVVEDFGEFPSRSTSGPLRSVRSLRVYEKEQEAELSQRTCARSAVFIGGGAATGAIIGR